MYKYPKLAAAQKIADKYGVKLFSSDKFPYKLMVRVGSRTVHFGDRRYEDYLIHQDKKRRAKYRARHINDRINDPLAAGFWAWRILW